MKHDGISISDALEKINQLYMVARIAEQYPSHMEDCEYTDMFTLIKNLASPVCIWLSEESARLEGEDNDRF